MSTGSSDPAARPTPRPAGRRWALRVGTLLLLAGVAGLAYVGWQTWGTTWLSERTHRETVADLEDARNVVSEKAAYLRETYGRHSEAYYEREILQSAQAAIGSRSINGWNALIHYRMKQLNDGM